MTHYAARDKLDPLRPPDWRWRRAEHLADWRIEDELTRRAARYRRLMTSTPTMGQRAATLDPQVHCALALDPRQALELEARILAGQSPRAAGLAMWLDPNVAQLRAGLMFDVHDRLDSLDYIHCRVLVCPSQEASVEARLAAVARWLSYGGGLLVAEATIAHLDLLREVVGGRCDFSDVESDRARRLAYLVMAKLATPTASQALHLAQMLPSKRLEKYDALEPVFARQTAQSLDQVLTVVDFQELGEPLPEAKQVESHEAEQVA